MRTTNEIYTTLVRNQIVLERLLTEVKAVKVSHLGTAVETALQATTTALLLLETGVYTVDGGTK